MMKSKVTPENTAVVLLQPALAENIGTAARAAANMGLGRLILVQPEQYDERVIRAVATRLAGPLVDGLTICDDIQTALADFQFIVGATARRGNHRGPFLTPRTLAEKIVDVSRENRVALLFGPERSGLSTADLRLCQAVVTIPTADPKVSSLNLAQAVLVIGYELLLALNPEPPAAVLKTAPLSELQAMYGHLSETLVKIGFLPDENTDHWLMSLKRIFNRTGLTHGDCNLIRGVCRQIDWAVRTGAGTRKPEK